MIPAGQWFAKGALVLALAWAPLTLAAHALPSSVVAVTVGPAVVGLTVTIPQGELAIVLPAVAGATTGAPLPDTVRAAVGDYLASHVALSDAAKVPLDLTIARMRLATATQDHLGQITVLVVDLQAGLPVALAGSPLTLTYDAVLHEVRNHRATVTLLSPGHPAAPLGEIRFDPAIGGAQPVVFATAP